MKRAAIPLAVAVLAAVAVVAFLADGHQVTGSPAARLRAWVTSTGLGEKIGTLQADATALAKAVAQHRSSGVLRTVCSAMATSAQTDNESLPAPDVTVTDQLSKAYGLVYDAAQLCYQAPSADSPKLATSARDSAAARAIFESVLARVHAVTGATVSTTTSPAAGGTGTVFP
jgi:hypothetical protein